ncbi:MAG: DnaJ domain-containing protein [bacterium]
MTKEEALKELGLEPSAAGEEIEKTYHKLVRRYPPEFHPDKFRRIDEAYRFLTSFSAMLERLLSFQTQSHTLDKELFAFNVEPPAGMIEEGIKELKKAIKMAHLWNVVDSR